MSSRVGTRHEDYSFSFLFSRSFMMSQKSSRRDLAQHVKVPGWLCRALCREHGRESALNGTMLALELEVQMLNLNTCLPGKRVNVPIKSIICYLCHGQGTLEPSRLTNVNIPQEGPFSLDQWGSSTSHFYYSEKMFFWPITALLPLSAHQPTFPVIITALSLCLSGKPQYSSIILSLPASPKSCSLAAGLVPWRVMFLVHYLKQQGLWILSLKVGQCWGHRRVLQMKPSG